MELPLPFILGCDLAGVVESVGPRADRFKPGDRVWGTNQGLLGRQGTFAQYCAIDQCWLYPTPDEVTDETAAACALVGVTAHLGLFGEARLRSGETVFVQGGSGGVGSMVIQMAKSAGARVFACVEEGVQGVLQGMDRAPGIAGVRIRERGFLSYGRARPGRRAPG